MITFGQSGRGKLIPEVTAAVNDTLMRMGHTSATTTDNGGRELEGEAPKYRLDITSQDPFGMGISDASFSGRGNTGKVTVTYPSSITLSDFS